MAMDINGHFQVRKVLVITVITVITRGIQGFGSRNHCKDHDVGLLHVHLVGGALPGDFHDSGPGEVLVACPG